MVVEAPLKSAKAKPVEGSAYLPLITAAFAAILLVVLFRSTTTAIVSTWENSVTFTHGFLILPIAGYLAWRQRYIARRTPIEPQLWGLALIILFSLVWLIGNVTATLLVEEMSLVAIGQSLFFTIFGWRMWRVFAFALLYTFLAIPVGLELVAPLQAQTAAITIFLLNATGVPVFSDGNLIQIPNGNFYVAEACSGIRYLIASVALGILVAGIAYRSWSRRIAFVAASFFVPILANGVRAYSIILLAYYTTANVAEGIDHIIYGWVFFSLVTFALLAIASIFREDDPRVGHTAAQAQPAIAPVSPRKLAFALTVAFVPLFLASAHGTYARTRPMPMLQGLGMPGSEPPWREDAALTDPTPARFAGADFQGHMGYTANDRVVFLNIGYYASNRRGAKAVSSDHALLPNSAIFLGSDVTTLTVDGHAITALLKRYSTGYRHRVITSFYWIDDQFAGNPYMAKILEAKAKLLGGQQAAAMIVLATDYDDMPERADQALRQFTAALHDLGATLRHSAVVSE